MQASLLPWMHSCVQRCVHARMCASMHTSRCSGVNPWLAVCMCHECSLSNSMDQPQCAVVCRAFACRPVHVSETGPGVVWLQSMSCSQPQCPLPFARLLCFCDWDWLTVLCWCFASGRMCRFHFHVCVVAHASARVVVQCCTAVAWGALCITVCPACM